MGAKPSRGTKADRRLKVNKDRKPRSAASGKTGMRRGKNC